MEFDAIALLLKQTIGLDPRSIGVASIERAVQRRALACGLRGRGAYLACVQASPAEMQELIEDVVVPETWFFRDRAAFAALGQLANSAEFRSRRPLRLLSAPCSTGEEPYSMSMTLREAGLDPDRFSIDALDISARALAQARGAVFGGNSFRGASLEFRQSYFDPVGRSHRLKPDAQRRVTFDPANLLDDDSFKHRGPYDVIFCRNVFIYFDAPAQERVLRLLRRLLAEHGVLFVGPAESGLMTDRGFVPAGWPGAFAFRQAETKTIQSQRGQSQEPLPSDLREESHPRAEPRSEFAAQLQRARQLADQAELREAAAVCESMLKADPESAEVLCLLGLVRDAEGEPEAARELYRQALYLDPTHAEALAHLASLNEKCGDHASARLLHQRAGRLHQKLQP